MVTKALVVDSEASGVHSRAAREVEVHEIAVACEWAGQCGATQPKRGTLQGYVGPYPFQGNRNFFTTLWRQVCAKKTEPNSAISWVAEFWPS